MKLDSIPELMTQSPGAKDAQIEALAGRFNLILPDDYVELLKLADGFTANRITLFSTSDIGERNETYEVSRCAPGYLLIGTVDDFPLLIRGERSSPLFMNDWGAMSVDFMEKIADSLSSWFERRCFVPGDDAPERPDHVDVYVVRVPEGGVRRLREVCNRLGLFVPVSQLGPILKSIPYCLCRHVPYLPTARLVSETSKADPCLGVFAVGKPDEPVSITPWEWK